MRYEFHLDLFYLSHFAVFILLVIGFVLVKVFMTSVLCHLQKTVFGGKPTKPDHKDVPVAVFRCHASSETC